jgi:hypothetical protein
MRSSRIACAIFFVASAARADGFALERLYPSAPGGGWIVMDDLGMHGGYGGAMSVSGGYARDPLAPIVTDEAFMNIGLALSYDRFRVYLDLPSPLAVKGQGAALDLGTAPDLIADARVGFDARLLGDAHDPFRMGLGAQIFFPNGTRADYVSDETMRAMFRLLFAGDIGKFTWAAHAGLHLRTQAAGPEFLFGAAVGVRLPIAEKRWAFVVGPEIYGEAALHPSESASTTFGGSTVGAEGLLSMRLERLAEDAPHLRFKLGFGPGFDPSFGSPSFRLVFSIELFAHTHAHEH